MVKTGDRRSRRPHGKRSERQIRGRGRRGDYEDPGGGYDDGGDSDRVADTDTEIRRRKLAVKYEVTKEEVSRRHELRNLRYANIMMKSMLFSIGRKYDQKIRNSSFSM